jgi:hypothetical protein
MMLEINDDIDLKPIDNEAKFNAYINILGDCLLNVNNFPYKVSCCLDMHNRKHDRLFE